MAIRTAIVDFFVVEVAKATGPTFKDALDEAMKLPSNEARTFAIGSSDPLRLQELHRIGKSPVVRFEGDLFRIRMDDLPPVLSTDGDLQTLDLNSNQGIGERSAWLAYPERNLVAFQRSRFVSPASYGAYLSRVIDDEQNFELVPLLKLNAYQKLIGMTEIRKVKIRVASPDASVMVGSGKTPPAMVEIMGDLRAPELEITASMGHQRSRGLNLQKAKQLVMGLYERSGRGDSDDVSKLEVIGRVEDEPLETVDLLHFRLRAKVAFEAGESRTIPYSARRGAVKTAYDKNREEIDMVLAAK